MGIIREMKVDCQDCGNANCQNSNHTFTYKKYIDPDELKATLNDYFRLQINEELLAILLQQIGFVDKDQYKSILDQPKFWRKLGLSEGAVETIIKLGNNSMWDVNIMKMHSKYMRVHTEIKKQIDKVLDDL